MANTESARRRGATPVAGTAKRKPTRAKQVARVTGRDRAGFGAAPVKAAAPPRDRFHALWGSGQLLAFLGALACAAALAYLLSAGSWQVRQIELAGATLTSQDAITTALGASGHNIFTVEPQSAANRLIALPTVREAQVWGELPDRLVVRIVERQPVIVWQRGDARFLLDANGFVIADNATPEAVQSLPVLVVQDGELPTVGGHVDAEIGRAVQTIGRRAPEFGVSVTGIEYASTTGLTLTTTGGAGATNGRRIVLGNLARLEEKLAIAGEIIRNEQSWSVVNITDPDRPFFPPVQP